MLIGQPELFCHSQMGLKLLSCGRDVSGEAWHIPAIPPNYFNFPPLPLSLTPLCLHDDERYFNSQRKNRLWKSKCLFRASGNGRGWGLIKRRVPKRRGG